MVILQNELTANALLILLYLHCAVQLYICMGVVLFVFSPEITIFPERIRWRYSNIAQSVKCFVYILFKIIEFAHQMKTNCANIYVKHKSIVFIALNTFQLNGAN